MASFTDNLQYLTNFTPYRQQIPLDEMKEVGVYKQAKYEEGVQKIQTNIDNIAGLDVARDIDKVYLQSKLNQLGNNLKTVAAGDFSNFQLVNSVNGMTSQIVKDENVQNAVSSAAKLKKEQAFMEKQRQEGKSSPSNEWDFNSKANSWINSSKLEQSFTGKYTPYTDVQKKYLEVFKSLHSDLTEQDIPYVIENGKVNYNKTAAAMQRISKESVSKEKIENALRASLTPIELEQLSIDGRYTFRNVLPEQIAEQSVKKYQSSIDKNNQSIKELKGFANLTGKAVLKEKALKSIESLEEDNKKLGVQLNEEKEYSLSNPEMAKITYYKNSSIEQFATANAWEHNKENVMANPVKAQDNWEREFAMAQTKLNLDISNASWDKKMDILNYNLKVKELDAAEKKALAKEKGEISQFNNYFGADTDIGDPMKIAAESLKSIKSTGDSIYKNIMSKSGATREQIRNAVSAYNSGDKTKYKKAISVIDPVFHNDIEKLGNLRKDIIVATSAFETAETYANNSKEVIQLEQTLNKRLQGLGNHVIETPNGKVSFTPQEMATYIGKRQLTSVGGAVVQTYSSPLTSKEKLLEKGTSSFKEADSFARFSTLISDIAPTLEKKRQEIKYKKFNELNQKWLPKLASITVGKGEGDTSRDFYEGLATNLIIGYDKKIAGQAGGNKYTSKDDLKELQDIYGTKDKEYLQYKVLQKGDEKILIVAQGSKSYMLPMKQNEWSQLPLDLDTQYQEVLNAQKAQGGTTNKSGLFENSWYTKKSFPNTTFNVKADLRTGNDVTQFPTIRIGTDAGVAVIPINSEFSSPQEAEMFFKSITDADLINAIKSADNDQVDPTIKALFK
jgi:hypothetical protein